MNKTRIIRITLLAVLLISLGGILAYPQVGPDTTKPPAKPKPVPAAPKPKPKPAPANPAPRPQTQQLPKEITTPSGVEMALIPAGRFMMGSENGEDNEKPVHEVEISQMFYLGKYEVTQAQWERVMEGNPSKFRGASLPVQQVSWNEVKEFIAKLNAKEGGDRYRLPTEAEWEYACRAGTRGDHAGSLDEMGWYRGNANGQTHPVGQKRPNGWGLYDMHGNVWEWCGDWYDERYYGSSSTVDPRGPSSGSTRVIRGGGWTSNAVNCRSAHRGNFAPGNRDVNVGFRLVRTLR